MNVDRLQKWNPNRTVTTDIKTTDDGYAYVVRECTEHALKWEVDAYVDHFDLGKKITDRVDQGWVSFRVIDCTPKNDREFVTIIWYKETREPSEVNNG